MTAAQSRRIVLLVVLAAFLLRVLWLDFQELRGDEVFGYFFSLQSFGDIVKNTFALGEPHPVGSYLLEHLWLNVVGQSEYSLRFLSVWFGTLAVAVLYRLARRLSLSPTAASVAAILFAVSPYAVWHSQDARMYSMSLALTLLSMWLALEWLERRGWRWAAGYAAVTLLALHTHYFTVFVLLVQNLYVLTRLLVRGNERARLAHWLVLQASIFLLYLPWLVMVRDALVSYHGNGDSPSFRAMMMRSLGVLTVGESIPADRRVWWALTAGVLILVSSTLYLRYGEGRSGRLSFLALYLLVPLVATWLSSRTRPIFNERYLVAAGPPLFLLFAAWVDSFAVLRGEARGSRRFPYTGMAPKPWLRYAAVGLCVIVAAGMAASLRNHYADPAFSKTRGWRELADNLARNAAGMPDGSVVFAQNFPDPTLWYYYSGPVEHVVLPPGAHDAKGARQTVEDLSASGVRRVILPRQPAPNWDDQNLAPEALATVYELIEEQEVGVWPVQVYELPALDVAPVTKMFVNGVGLTGYGVTRDRPAPGSILGVTLAWRRDGEIAGTEKVFLHLLDGQGAIVAQADRGLAPNAHEQMKHEWISAYGILLPSDMKPGEYTLISGLYDPGMEGAPRIVTSDGSDSVFLKTVIVDQYP